MPSNRHDRAITNEPESVFGWNLCDLMFQLPDDEVGSIRGLPPLTEGQHLKWCIGDWEPGVERVADEDGFGNMNLCGKNLPRRLLSENFQTFTEGVLVEVKGWGKVNLSESESYWLASVAYPLSAALVCQTCLLSDSVQPAQHVIASSSGFLGLFYWSGEGTCREHLDDRIKSTERELERIETPHTPDTVDVMFAGGKWNPQWLTENWNPDRCKFLSSRAARLTEVLRNFAVRVLPASDVENEIISRYGLAKLDVQEFQRKITENGYDYRCPIKAGVAPILVAKERNRGARQTSPLSGASHSHGLSKVAGMHKLKNQLYKEVVRPFRDPRPFVRYGLTIPNGILLYGPPGCGKTYFARQLAEELGCSFIELIPSEVASPYIHGSVPGIREVFEKAQTQAPCVLFIDEFEALVPSRADLGGFQQYKAEEVNEFLAQMNSCAAKNVLVIAATNEPWKIDSAVLRTGRLDKHFYVDPPDAKARAEMLALHMGGRFADPVIDFVELASRLEGYSASDIKFIVEEAARDAMEHDQPISVQHIESAKRRVPPSVTEEVVQRYLSFHTRGVAT